MSVSSKINYFNTFIFFRFSVVSSCYNETWKMIINVQKHTVNQWVNQWTILFENKTSSCTFLLFLSSVGFNLIRTFTDRTDRADSPTWVSRHTCLWLILIICSSNRNGARLFGWRDSVMSSNQILFTFNRKQSKENWD